jgi:integrative and conjugative element protein (TIGR02256 family)
MRFRRPDGGELRISLVAVDTMNAHMQRKRWAREAGGVLLGRLLLEDDKVVVEQVTVPGPYDRRSRFTFFRAERPAQAVVNDAWRQSGGELVYLGEWHTHPEDDPSPSGHDRSDWRRLVTTQQYEQPSLFFIIVGRLGIRAWEFRKAASAPVPLASPDSCGDITR